MKKKKKFDSQKTFEALRRQTELKEYGRILSLRPARVHESKKKYKRNKKVDLYDD
jgi:hypothetical protein